MMKPEVHVYGSGREFVVASTIRESESTTKEITPVERISLAMGRPTVVELSRALRTAKELSAAAEATGVTPWNGDDGRWWQHNLIFVVIQWDDEGALFLPQQRTAAGEWKTADHRRYSEGATLELAEALVAYLGEQLRG